MVQSRVNSFIESVIGALLAAPSASGLHWLLLDIWGNSFTEPHIKGMFVSLSLLSFFLHSVFWKFIIRRILVRYNCENLTTLVKTWLK